VRGLRDSRTGWYTKKERERIERLLVEDEVADNGGTRAELAAPLVSGVV
jgi:hypothetical protein